MLRGRENVETSSIESLSGYARKVGVLPRFASMALKRLGVNVERYSHSIREGELPPPKDHVVVLTLGGPCGTERHGEGGLRKGKFVRGDASFLPAGAPTRWVFEDDVDVLHLELQQDFLERVAGQSGAKSQVIEIRDTFLTNDRLLWRVGLDLMAELRTDGLGGELYAESLANVLALHLLRYHSSLGRGDTLKVANGREKGLSTQALRRASDYVDDNLGGDLSLGAIARAANVSPYHFARAFKLSTGKSPHQYVVQRRVERAKDLLKNTDLTVGEVASEVGFAHQSHLASHTRRLLGVAPRDLR